MYRKKYKTACKKVLYKNTLVCYHSSTIKQEETVTVTVTDRRSDYEKESMGNGSGSYDDGALTACAGGSDSKAASTQAEGSGTEAGKELFPRAKETIRRRGRQREQMRLQRRNLYSWL